MNSGAVIIHSTSYVQIGIEAFIAIFIFLIAVKVYLKFCRRRQPRVNRRENVPLRRVYQQPPTKLIDTANEAT